MLQRCTIAWPAPHRTSAETNPAQTASEAVAPETPAWQAFRRPPRIGGLTGAATQSAPTMETKAQNDQICVTQVKIISRPAAAQIGGSACCYDLHLAAFGTSWTACMSVSTSAGFAD